MCSGITLREQGGGTSDPLWSLLTSPILRLNFEGCEQHFTTQNSHFQSCQAHIPQTTSQMIWVPAFRKSQAPGATCPAGRGASYHQSRYPWMARVKPCINQHTGVTKITEDREIWLNYCSFHQVLRPTNAEQQHASVSLVYDPVYTTELPRAQR